MQKKKHTVKNDFTVCFNFTVCFLSTLGKIYVCRVRRVPVNLYTTNFRAHGESEISGSADSLSTLTPSCASKAYLSILEPPRAGSRPPFNHQLRLASHSLELASSHEPYTSLKATTLRSTPKSKLQAIPSLHETTTRTGMRKRFQLRPPGSAAYALPINPSDGGAVGNERGPIRTGQ